MSGGPPSGSPLSGGRIAVGRINGAWGLRGHVKVTPLTSNPERFKAGAVLLVSDEPRRVREVLSPKGYPCIQFEGYLDRTAAETLRGALIEIDEADLPPLPDREHYVHDLLGLAVVTPAGDEIGRIEEVLKTGANDVYLVRRPGRKDALIPAITEVVMSVDLEQGRMVVDPLPGLLDEPEDR